MTAGCVKIYFQKTFHQKFFQFFRENFRISDIHLQNESRYKQFWIQANCEAGIYFEFSKILIIQNLMEINKENQ